ncbi:MAG TPA: TonB-dependent receptor [Bryobacteraceae bacterium]|nr:TonB-dependent receptor [Bryobacteraceae bacterium]
MTARKGYLTAVLLSLASVAVAEPPEQIGVVTSANQPIPGATVTAIQETTIVVTTTDQNGYYSLQLGQGEWMVEVTMVGFQPAKKGLTVSNAARQLDFSLQLKESPVSARLSGPEQNGDQLESQLQNELESNQALQITPAENVDDSNEAFLVSGTLSKGPSSNSAPDSSPLQTSFGSQPGARGAGTPNLNVPGFTGGRSSRRAAARRSDPVPARSGNRRQANEIHGTLTLRVENSALNGKPFSITGQDIPQPAYAQSRFTAAVGGPLVIPKIVKDPATFFFLNYNGTRYRNPYTAVETVPTELERQGNFSQSIQAGGSVQIYDPTTHQPFFGNVIPGPRIDPIAKRLLSYVPLPNQPGLVNNYDLQASVRRDTDDLDLRVQRNITTIDRLAYDLTFQRRDGDVSQPFGFLDATGGAGLNTDLQWTRNLSTRLINNARVTFKRNSNDTTPYFANGQNVALDFGIHGTSSNPLNYGPPNLNFTNFGALSDTSPVLTRNQSQTFSDNLIAVRGLHSFTFGVQFTRNDLNTRSDPNGRGTFNFTGLLTSAFGANGSPVVGTGFDFADFLLGLPQSSAIRYGDSSTYLRENVWTGFAQDDWKVRPNLTLNLGLRYEYFSPFYEKYGHIANLDVAPGFSAVALVTPGGASGPYSGGFPFGLIDPDYSDVSPRVGLAWKVPYFKQSTIVRAGYGAYYNGQAYSRLAFKLAQQPPFAVSSNVNTGLTNPLSLADGFVSAPGEVTNTFAVGRHYRTPYAQTWNMTIQREFGKGFFVEAGYLGTKGTRLDVLTLPNQGPPGALSDKHQLGDAIGFTYNSSVGNSIFHALTVRATQRFRRGFSMSAYYQFSKSIDDSSTFGGAGNTVAENWLNLAAERGLSSFDRRHSFDMNWVLTSQVGTAGSRFSADSWTTRLLKDWQLSGLLTAQTGTPLTARVLGNSAIALAQTGGVGSSRAEATGLNLSSAGDFFNLAAFTVPAPGEFGNAGRNTIPGPGLFAVNLAFGRSFRLDESRRRLEFRIEAKNVFNSVSFLNINTVVNATNYGLPISAAPMRVMDAVVRFRF